MSEIVVNKKGKKVVEIDTECYRKKCVSGHNDVELNFSCFTNLVEYCRIEMAI